MVRNAYKRNQMNTFFHHSIKITIVLILLAACFLFAETTIAEPTEKKTPATINKFENVTEKMRFTGLTNSAEWWAAAWGVYNND